MTLSREGLICGPSSGMALRGLHAFLADKQAAGRLQDLADPVTSEVACAFLCCDLPYQYLDTYFQKADPQVFNPNWNHNFLHIDQGPCNPLWELIMPEVAKKISLRLCRNGPRVPCANTGNRTASCCASLNDDALGILDLRQPDAFASEHAVGSINTSLPSLSCGMVSPFADLTVLETQHHNLQQMAQDCCLMGRLRRGRGILAVCYNGETTRLAASVLRAAGVEAFSLRGGFHAITVAAAGASCGTVGRAMGMV